MTQFTKGDKRINRKGRTPGTPNRSTSELRQLVQSFVEDNWHTTQKAFDRLDDKDKLLFLEKLLKHTLPTPLPELERMTEAQLDAFIQQVKQLHYEAYTQKQN